MTGGAEKKSELKGSIVTWGARELAEMEEERQKYREIEDHQGGWRESTLRGTHGRERRDGRQGRSREEDRHSRRAEKGRCRKK